MDIKGKVDRSELREIKTFLAENIRTDWHFSPTSSSLHSQQTTVALSYCERYYGTSDSDTQDDAQGEKRNEKGHVRSDPYKFDSPDTVASTVEHRRVDRKRKRQQMLEDEMQTNEGLRFFVQRRNAWTGARDPSSVTDASSGPTRPSTDQKRPDSGFSSSPASAPTTTTTTTATSISAVQTSTDNPISHPPQASQPPTDLLSASPLLPVYPPLVPYTHTLRAATRDPKNYGELYSKIVLSARTPSVPVNLADMTRALVQGWRDSGEWPPNATTLEPSVARRRKNDSSKVGGDGRSGGKGETRGAARVLRLFGGGSGGGGKAEGQDGREGDGDGDGDVKMVDANGEGVEGKAAVAPQSPVKRGIQSVRKVFRLSAGSAGGGNGEAG